ncbi:uncharacterized protein [Macrobrachium rosenbergii]|uniref:uncharacterized protein n=1 Tax=Macrobrachium rosenbergii TaxID=79674 RepID=UPI0034D61926
MPYLGNVADYNPDLEDFDVYVERVQLFFTVNDIEEEKKTAVFLTLVGPKNYAILRDLIHPSNPNSKTFDELILVLKNHFSPVRSVIAERFKFNRRRQGSDETISDYVAVLKNMSSTCQYGDFLNDALRDKFVVGIADVEVQRELLRKNDLSFAKAVELAVAFEMTKKSSRELRPFNVASGDDETLQRVMDTILSDIDNCGCLLDDIIVTGKNNEDHLQNLRKVLDRLLEIRLAADASAYGLGAVISHLMPDGSERPIAYPSRSLKVASPLLAESVEL